MDENDFEKQCGFFDKDKETCLDESGGRKVIRMIGLKEKLVGLAFVALAMAAVMNLPL